jgi:phage shock protein PspC (stress-responsive transcriptional regulator)
MSDTFRGDAGPGPRTLRRSKDDRVAVGVAGGLGRFFGVDPIIFRVLFVALSFMGLAGVVVYLACYAAIPEEGAVNSPLDRAVAGLREKGVPIWVALAVASSLAWIILLSWWSPVPFAAIAVIAVILGLGLSRVRAPHAAGAAPPEPAGAAAPQSAGAAPPEPADVAAPASTIGVDPTTPHPSEAVWGPSAAQDAPTVSLQKTPAESGARSAWPRTSATQPSSEPPTEQPLPTASEQLRQWWGEAQTAAKASDDAKTCRRRGWITEAVTYALLGSVWLILGLVTLGTPIPVQAFLWSGFGIIIGCALIGALLRRPRWRMLVGAVFLTLPILIIGNYPLRIGDPSGQQMHRPAAVGEVATSYRMLAGEQVLDLSDVDFDRRIARVHISHGAGKVLVTVPADVDVVLDAKVRLGEILAFDGRTEGLQNHREQTSLGKDGRGGGTLRLTIEVLAGQAIIERG